MQINIYYTFIFKNIFCFKLYQWFEKIELKWLSLNMMMNYKEKYVYKIEDNIHYNDENIKEYIVEMCDLSITKKVLNHKIW